MKELTTEQKAKAYDKAIKKAESLYKVAEPMSGCNVIIETLFPSFKKIEDKDKRIIKALIQLVRDYPSMDFFIKYNIHLYEITNWLEQREQETNDDEDILQRFSFYSYKDEPNILYLSGLYVNSEHRNKGIGTKILKIADEVAASMKCNSILLKTEIDSNAERLYKNNGYSVFRKEGNQVWLKKQGNITKLNVEEYNKFAKSVLSNCAMSFINYLDAHKYEGKMCVSNGECEDIENAFRNAMWDRLHRYYCKYIEKQGEQKQIQPKFKVGDIVKHKKNPHLTYILKRFTDDGDYEFHAIGKDGHEGCTCFAVVKYQDEWELVEQKTEPKFKNGQWIVWQNKCYKVNDNGCGYKLIDQNGLSTSLEYGTIDESARLWDITKDAKDGDVLSYRDGQWIFIYKGIVTEDTFKYYALLSEKGITVNDAAFSLLSSCITPATKEQRDTLEKAMADAGYTFDFEKKELKKIEQKFNIGDEIKITNEEPLTITKIDEKGYWSEDLFICSFDDAAKWELVEHKPDNVEYEQEINYPDNLPKDNWELIQEFVNKFGRIPKDEDELNALVEYVLKRQKSWSEEDEKMFNSIVVHLNATCGGFPEDEKWANNFLDWLKSLKNRYTWKPSLAQLNALSIVSKGNAPDDIEAIVSLYNDLKKLREE